MNKEKKDQVQFHLFDTIFFHAFNALVEAGEYDFLKLGFFFDKHYLSPKRTAENSIFIFLVPCVDQPRECIIVAAVLDQRRIAVFDPLESDEIQKHTETYAALKEFINDYIGNFPINYCDTSEGEESKADRLSGKQLGKVSDSSFSFSRESRPDIEVKDWKVEEGQCFKLSKSDT